MQKELCSVKNDDQTGYIKGRFIDENIRRVSDIIKNNKYKNGILLFLDFRKAFDSVEWDFCSNLRNCSILVQCFVNGSRQCIPTPFSV